MKKAHVIASAVAALVSTPALAAPGNSATAQGEATATVIAPITLTHDVGAALSFGTFTAGNGGTVTVNKNNGNGTAGGDVTLVSGSVESADSFTVGGDPNRAFQVTTANGTVSDGSNTMTFTTDVKKNHTLDGSGAATFTVGGELTVPDSAPAGTYTGQYDATVTYN